MKRTIYFVKVTDRCVAKIKIRGSAAELGRLRLWAMVHGYAEVSGKVHAQTHYIPEPEAA